MRSAFVTFRPSFWRSYLWFLIPALFGVLFAVRLNMWRSNELDAGAAWLRIGGVGLACFLFGGLLGTALWRDRLTITVTDEAVAGPSAWMWRRVSFPLHILDRERTCAPSRLQRTFGYRYLWSTAGDKILVNPWRFDSATMTTLFTQLHCPQHHDL